MEIKLDKWQQEFLDTKGDKILCTGRQVGKSIICAMDAGNYAATHKNETLLMIAPTERQAYALFEKTLQYLLDNHRKLIKKGKDRPTKTKINLTTGIKIYCLPTGLAGLGIRFLTVNRLYGEEAARIPEEVWSAVTPMLLTTGGSTILLSTPAGKEGFFYDVYSNRGGAFDSFRRFSVTSEEVIKNRPTCGTWTEKQREQGLEMLARERERMTKLQYAQEYLGMFLDELRQFFATELIKKCMILKRDISTILSNERFLGVDIARMGEDESVLISVEKIRKDRIKQFDMEITKKTLLTETADLILAADKKRGYKKIYLDDGGLGAGVFDILIGNSQTKRKVIGINNSTRVYERDSSGKEIKEKKKRLLKEDLYNNLLNLMERGRVEIFDEPEILVSLKSVQYEQTDAGEVKIFGRYTHIAEALVRAAWCIKEKRLNIYVY